MTGYGRDGHVWDDIGICQVHGGYCSMAPATPDLAGLPLDAPVPYRLTSRAWRALAATATAPVRAPVRAGTATTQTGSRS